jgi:hypothetical protein
MYTDVKNVGELKSVIFKDLYQKHVNLFKQYFDSWNLREIGLPYKYGFGKNMTKWIWGALFFNTFFKDELRPGASMYSVYIKYDVQKLKRLLADKYKWTQYSMHPDFVEKKWNMLSVSVELGAEFHDKYKDTIKMLENEIDFKLSWDDNLDININKKFDQFKTFFS